MSHNHSQLKIKSNSLDFQLRVFLTKEHRDKTYVRASTSGFFSFHAVLEVDFVVRIAVFKLVVANQKPQMREKGPKLHKRYVDNNLLQLLVLKMFLGPLTKCSAVCAITD